MKEMKEAAGKAAKADIDSSVELMDVLRRLAVLQGTFVEKAGEMVAAGKLEEKALTGEMGILVGLLLAMSMESQSRGAGTDTEWCAKAAEHYGVWSQLKKTTEHLHDTRAKIADIGYSPAFYDNAFAAIERVGVDWAEV